MAFDVAKLLADATARTSASTREHMNPQLARVLQDARLRPLLRPGRGLLPLRRPGPALPRPARPASASTPSAGATRPSRPALHQAIDLDLPNMVQMDCALLPGPPGRGAGRPGPRGHRPGLLLQLGRRGGRGGDQVRPPRHRQDPHPLLRPRLPRAHHRRPGPQRRARSSARASARSCPARRGPLRRHRRARAASCAGATWPPSSSSRSRARASTWRPTPTGTRPRSSAAATRRCFVTDEVQTGLGPDRAVLLPRALGPRARHHHRLQGPLGRLRPGRGHAHDRQGVHERLQLDGPGHGPLDAPSGATSWPWWPAWPPCQAFDDEDIVDRARRDRRGLHQGPPAAGRALRVLPRGAGQGPHDRPRVRPADLAGPCGCAGTRSSGSARRCSPRPIVVPLFHRHRILTQVAADNVNIIKLLPPLIAGEDEVDAFVDALDDVLARRPPGLGPVLRVRPDDGQERAPRAARRCRRRHARTHGRPPTEPRARRRPPLSETAVARHRGGRVHRLGRHPGPARPGRPRCVAARRAGRRPRQPGRPRRRAVRTVDVRDAEGLGQAVDGAGRSSTSPPCTGSGRGTRPSSTTSTSEGTRNVLGRGSTPGASGSSTRARWPRSGSRPGPARPTRTSYADIDHLFGAYKQSKYVAEHEVLRAGAEGAARLARPADLPARAPRPPADADRQAASSTS